MVRRHRRTLRASPQTTLTREGAFERNQRPQPIIVDRLGAQKKASPNQQNGYVRESEKTAAKEWWFHPHTICMQSRRLYAITPRWGRALGLYLACPSMTRALVFVNRMVTAATLRRITLLSVRRLGEKTFRFPQMSYYASRLLEPTTFWRSSPDHKIIRS